MHGALVHGMQHPMSRLIPSSAPTRRLVLALLWGAVLSASPLALRQEPGAPFLAPSMALADNRDDRRDDRADDRDDRRDDREDDRDDRNDDREDDRDDARDDSDDRADDDSDSADRDDDSDDDRDEDSSSDSDDRDDSRSTDDSDTDDSSDRDNDRIRNITVTYPDGWVERIINGQYELIDNLNRQVIRRPATAEDFARMIALG